MSREEETTSQEKYTSILNGWVDNKNSAKNPQARREIRYYNPNADKMQSQNYLEMQDLVVPVIVREHNGRLEFAMQYEYIPAINKVLLELPDCPFFSEKKSKYSVEDVLENVEKRMEGLGLTLKGLKNLDSSETAVSQSFTDQQAKFVMVFVEDDLEEKSQLQWFPITALQSYFEKIKESSSLQTKYALKLFYESIRERLKQEEPTEFEYDEDLLGKEADWKDIKNIMEHKYRFGIELSEGKEDSSEKVAKHGEFAEYGQSKNSVQCLMIRKSGDKIEIGLSKQQRSPFILRDGVDEYFYEAVAGMLEEGETYEDAAERETLEEAGIKFEKGKLIHLSSPAILSKATEEYSDFYMYEMESIESQERNLDEQENIEEIEWFNLDEIDLEKLHAPLPTKFLILNAIEYYRREREKDLQAQSNDKDER